MKILENVEPRNVFKFFEDISNIPRASKNEDAVCEYLINFAKERGLEVIKDDFKNVIIKKDASKGYEKAEGVILQGHSDMVAEKNSDTDHDFDKDPLKLYVEGEFLKARGTTLGADNGIAVAYALAVLDGNYNHPKLCVVITADEEAGMSGAKNLDLNLIAGYTNFINLDTDREGIFTVSCAGGMGNKVVIPIKKANLDDNMNVYEVRITGLVGGHSGMDIHKNLANSNRLMARFLHKFASKFSGKLISVNGGMKSNAIPREAIFVVATENTFSKVDFGIFVEETTKIFKNEHIDNEPNLNISFKETSSKTYLENGEDIINVLMTLPYGVLRQTEDGVISSTNIGVVTTEEHEITIVNATRSSILSLRDFMKDQIEVIAKMAGGYVESTDGYPAWEYKKENPLRDIAVKVYKEFSGKNAKIELSHGGLECGIFASKMEGINFIAMGPDNYNLHTPDEQLNIPSAKRVFEFLVKFLEQLK